MLLGNLDALHAEFVKENPHLKISVSAFTALRPEQCIPVGAKGTHNVCVCKIHGNIRLKMRGLKEEFLRKKFDYQDTYRDYLEAMVCSKPTADCFFGNCKNCPGTVKILNDLKESLQRHGIESVSFNQWLTTDRYLIYSAKFSNFFFYNFS